MKIGIVGLPNVGKSTLFNALTESASAAAENFPFCTIEPNVGNVPVPDVRLDALAKIVQPEKIVPTTVKFVDIAGLVRGAASGEGLGNKFLANIRECDAILLVTRFFEDGDVTHVEGDLDPDRDAETIITELCLADLETVGNRIARGKKLDAGEKVLLEKLRESLEKGIKVNEMEFSDDEIQIVREFQLLTAKKFLFAANVGESEVNDEFKVLGENAVPFCAKFEADLVGLDAEDKKMFLDDANIVEAGIGRLIRAAYEVLGLQTYFTAGKVEVRAWTVRKGARAPEAAGVIHTDFEKKFIRAEVMFWEDFVGLSGEKGCREAGKLRAEGKEYVVRDGDVMNFLHG